MRRVTEEAHAQVARVLRPGDVAVDATAGNGHDTVFLAECVGPEGRVFAFDCQPEAIAQTRTRLVEHGVDARVELVLGDHAQLADVVPAARCGAVLFNLGYLPGGDHAITTSVATTIPALDASLTRLRPGGVLSVVVYPGHPEGAREAAAIERWVPTLGGGAAVHGRAEAPEAPYLVTVVG